VPEPGSYLVLVRYEAAYRFETRFHVRVEQRGKRVFDRQYGSRGNLKIWAFRQGLKKERAWVWGAVENIVWEGHDAVVQLQAGRAKVSLVAGPQPGDAARRHVDLVMLTSDHEQVQDRVAKENYLPLDGMLTQAGDLHLRVRNHHRDKTVTLKVPNGTEHSPYWVHLRNWKPMSVSAEPGKTSDWIEAGSLLDTLNDGQWTLTASGEEPLHYTVEFATNRGGRMKSIGSFKCREPRLNLAYDANTRYTRRIRLQEDVLYELVEFLKKHPVRGKRPVRTLVYALTFDARPNNPRYTAARNELLSMFPILPRDSRPTGPIQGVSGYIDVRGLKEDKLEDYLKELRTQGLAANIASVSLGDEISLPKPPGDDSEGFRRWAQSRKIKPEEIDPSAGGNWARIKYSPDHSVARSSPRLHYYSKLYSYDYGIQAVKPRTDLIRRYLPHAGVGANFSPHHGHMYLGETYKWIDLFRQGGMTMPWSEDYIWQPPVGTQQMNFINLDLFRAGLKGKPEAKIHYYVMPHWPGNTPDSWRRQFYGDLAHGMKIVDLFEFRPVQAAYTENHVSLPEMYLAVRRALYELGLTEDIIQDGRVRRGIAALWLSRTGDVWDDNAAPFGAAKRALYIAIRHQQLPLDFVTESDALADDLRGYKVLYLADRHVSRAASQAIADWVHSGGILMATASAGLLDEFNEPNDISRELLGIAPARLEMPADQNVTFIKQDLPFVLPMDVVTWFQGRHAGRIPVVGARARFQAEDAQVTGVFQDGSPAVSVRGVGQGRAIYCGFLPGLSYFAPAVPKRPADRGTKNTSMAHFIPTEFDRGAYHLVGSPAADMVRPIVCSEPLVESTVIESPHGVVVPLINWSAAPVKHLAVTVNVKAPSRKAELASGKPLTTSGESGSRVFHLDLDVADALILR
jgi:hypothetical protein